MKRPIQHPGRGSSSLILLAVSTILLAAGGEAMRHTHATVSEGRWAAPGVRLAAAVTAADTALVSRVAHAAGSAETTAETASTPWIWTNFRPFVLFRIPYDRSTYTNGGEVMGVSNHGEDLKAIAVGYVVDDDEDPQPFMFTAATNTVAMLDMGSGAYESGIAMSISPDGLTIAGWAFHTSSSKMKAVVWEAPNYQIDATLSPSTDSYWNAVSNSDVPAGAYWVSNHYESVVGNGGPGYPFSGSEGEAKGINASGRVCGWYWNSQNVHAYRWDSLSGGNDIHPTGQQGYGDDSGANCINSTHHIGGWVINDNEKHIAAHWIPMSLQGVHYEVSAFSPYETASFEVVAINSRTEMLINRVDEVPGIALWIDNSVVNDAVLLDTPFGLQGEAHLFLMPNPDDHMYEGRCLNDDLWIGGSYLVHGEGDPEPCLAIPYDVDNNGHPDIREIMESMNEYGTYDLDLYVLLWLLDKGENIAPNGGGMRIGLNAPAYAEGEETHDIEHTQVVRLPLGIHNPNFASAGPDEFYVNGILHSGQGSQCAAFQTGVNSWAQISQGTGREIVLTLRSNLDDSDPDHDYLPTAPNVDLGEGVTKQHLLANLHWFGYKFAKCVDWIQLGNEAFSSSDPDSFYYGHGGYRIWAEEVGDCWTTGLNPREFEDITCPFPAIEAVQAWHYEQMWSILEGSALAGRPLRIVGPAIPMDTIIECYEEDTTVGWKVIDRTARWCNDYQVWFDMHARYLVREEVEDARNYLVSNTWTPPHSLRLVCLELAPKVDESLGWWTGGGSLLFNKLMGIPQCDAGNGTWSNFLVGENGWHQAQFSNEVKFGWGDAVNNLFGQRFTILCYGSTLQWPVIDPLWDLPALRAQNACAENFPNNEPQFSVLKDYYEEAAENYQIENFDPHENACASCPGN